MVADKRCKVVAKTETNVIELNESNYHQVVAGDGIVLIDCWASWCGSCSSFTPAYEKIASQYESHTFAKLDAESNRELIQSLGITHIPTVLLYRDGILLFQQAGAFDEKGLKDIVSQAESIDMEMVRSEISKMSKTPDRAEEIAPDS
jgi:thioredoxin 1